MRSHVFGAVALFLGATAVAQNPSDLTKVERLSFASKLGSFKLQLRDDKDLVKGTLEISFTGTVLISGLSKDGVVTPGPGVRLEYKDDEHSRRVYFGTGKLTMTGTARSVQFFGRDVSGTFLGRGVFRFYGEFDRNLKTGDYWYWLPTDTKAERTPWGTYGMQAVVPKGDPATIPQQPIKGRKIGG